jgi:hypothetical protein
LTQLVCCLHGGLVILLILIEFVGLSVKTIKVIIPQEGKNKKARVREVSLTSNQELRAYLRGYWGAFLSRPGEARDVRRFEDLVNGETYVIGGGQYDAIQEEKKRAQVEDRMFEAEAALAVQESLKERGIDAHIHQNVEILDLNTGNSIMELDAVVHVGGPHVNGSTAYLVECAQTPQTYDVDRIEKKVDKFKKHATKLPHFGSVVEVVAVLAGRNWLPETIEACSNRTLNLWRVCPSDKSLKVISPCNGLPKCA